jgi:hypothetical protein
MMIVFMNASLAFVAVTHAYPFNALTFFAIIKRLIPFRGWHDAMMIKAFGGIIVREEMKTRSNKHKERWTDCLKMQQNYEKEVYY